MNSSSVASNERPVGFDQVVQKWLEKAKGSTWRGVPLEDLTSEELIAAVANMASLYVNALVSKHG